VRGVHALREFSCLYDSHSGIDAIPGREARISKIVAERAAQGVTGPHISTGAEAQARPSPGRYKVTLMPPSCISHS
jgi:hypothetical protein